MNDFKPIDDKIKSMKEFTALREIHTHVFIVDTRHIPSVVHLFGRCKLPLPLTVTNGNKIRWRIENMAQAPLGVISDIKEDNVCITFLIASVNDGRDLKGRDLLLMDIKDLFIRFDPNLKFVNLEVR